MNNIFEEGCKKKEVIDNLNKKMENLKLEKKYILNEELRSMKYELSKLEKKLINDKDNEDIINQIVNIKININDTKNKIIMVYDEKIEKCQKLLDEHNLFYNDLKVDVEKISTFNYDLVVKYILRLFEDFNYNNYSAIDITYEYNDDVFFSDNFITTNCNKVITCIKEKEDIELNFDYDIVFKVNDYIYNLVEKGYAMLLSNNIYTKKSNQIDSNILITFYTVINGCITPNVQYGKFKFVKDFIDNLIIYIQENEVADIDDKVMNTFYSDFINKDREKCIQRKKEKLIK